VTLPTAILKAMISDLDVVDAPLPTLAERDADTSPCDLDWYAQDVMPGAYAPDGLPY